MVSACLLEMRCTLPRSTAVWEHKRPTAGRHSPGVAAAVAPFPGVAAQDGPGAAAAARRGLKEARAVINHIGMSELKFSVTLQRFMTPTVGDVKK